MERSRARAMVSSVTVPQDLGVRRKGHWQFGGRAHNFKPIKKFWGRSRAGKGVTEVRGSREKCWWASVRWWVQQPPYLQSSKSQLYLILIRPYERTPLLSLKGMGSWGIQMRGHLGRLRVGREWGYSCLWVAMKWQGALLCWKETQEALVLGATGMSTR